MLSAPPARLLAALLLFLGVIALPALGATVEVRVTDENGLDVTGVELSLGRLDADSAGPGRRGPLPARASTGASGTAQFAGVVPGQYEIGLIDARWFVRPQDNPLAPPQRLTVRDAAEVVAVELVVHRGVTLHALFSLQGAQGSPGARVVLREVETGFAAELGLKPDEAATRRLFAGRWEVRLDAPEGYLLVDLQVNGRAIAGHVAELEVLPGSPDVHVAWSLVAPAHLSGRIAFVGPEFPLEVQARLVEAGPWLAAAEQRGGSRYASVTAGVFAQTSTYSMDLPDGRWTVTPIGDGLQEAQPPEAQITLGPGEHGSQDFTVEGQESEGQSLSVRVIDASHRGIDDAIVELWPREPAARGAEPVGRERTRFYGMAHFPRVAKGSYVVAAVAAGYLEGRQELAAYDPDKKSVGGVTVELRRGGIVKVTFIEPVREPPAGARVALERLDDRPELIITEPAAVAALLEPAASPDATGVAWLRGLYPGRYRASGSMPHAVVELDDGGTWREAVEIVVAGDATVEQKARVVPAASVIGTVHCDGGERLPGRISVHVLPASVARPADPFDLDWVKNAVLASRDLALTGGQHDAFEAGPLEPGSYLVALRPASFERWTWAFGTEDAHEAGSFEVAEREPTGLGAIRIECGPAIGVRLKVASGHPAPNLRAVVPRAGNFTIAGTIRTAEGQVYEIDEARVRPYASVLMLHDLHEGTADLELRVGNGYFLPEYWVRVPVRGKLERGVTLHATAELADVGGRVLVHASAGHARLTAASGVARTVGLANGTALFENVPAGTYRLELCPDESCVRARVPWPALEVKRLETVELVE